MWDTLIKFCDMGIQSFLIFGDNCRIFLKDMGYFWKKIMGYGILGPPPPRLKNTWLGKKYHGNSDLCQNSSKTTEWCASALTTLE